MDGSWKVFFLIIVGGCRLVLPLIAICHLQLASSSHALRVQGAFLGPQDHHACLLQLAEWFNHPFNHDACLKIGVNTLPNSHLNGFVMIIIGKIMRLSNRFRSTSIPYIFSLDKARGQRKNSQPPGVASEALYGEWSWIPGERRSFCLGDWSQNVSVV